MITLVASNTITSSNAGTTPVVFSPPAVALIVQLDVTAIGTDVGDTFDVTVQTMIDGVNWVDVIHFTQLLGNGGTKRFIAKLVAGAAEAMFENGTALAAGNIRNLIGDQWRVKTTIVDSGTVNATFTYSVTAQIVGSR